MKRLKKDTDISKFQGVVHRGFQKCGGPDPRDPRRRRPCLPPPPPSQPPIGHPVRSMQIRGDFHVGKMGVGLQYLFPRSTCADATADVLWYLGTRYGYEKEEL